MTTPTTLKSSEHLRRPQSGEPGAGSRGPDPDVWPFETPQEQRERIPPPPQPARDERDVERPAERERP
jgi:hypothetical protein